MKEFVLVVVESPYSGNIEKNLRYSRACMKDCLQRSEAPFASHALYTQPGVLRDEDAEEREFGINAGFAWRKAARKTVVYTDLGVSKGMEAGIAHAQEMGHQIEYRTLGLTFREDAMTLDLTHNKLVLFLYLLMRDVGPTGDIVQAARMTAEIKDDPIFTSKELEAYAKRIAMEMTK